MQLNGRQFGKFSLRNTPKEALKTHLNAIGSYSTSMSLTAQDKASRSKEGPLDYSKKTGSK